MTYVCEIDQGHNKPVEENKTDKDIDLCPPRDDEWIADETDLGPVESKKAHAQAVIGPKQGVDGLVLWFDPADPRERAQERHEITWTIQLN